MAKKFYLTSAIPYVNAAPHIGHAQEFVYADTIRRFKALTGRDVTYLCGADENALKIAQAAEKAGMNIQDFCNLHNEEFQNVAKFLNVKFDIWQRGSDNDHHFQSSQKLWNLCYKNGYIYKKKYTGLYCVGCEQFYTPNELNENGECFEHPGKKLDQVSEENYFFALNKLQNKISDLLQSDSLKIFPEFRKNEAMGFVKKGLEDFSISRSKERAKGWGIPVPGDQDQIMYVWFDALNIYHTGIGFGWDEQKFNLLAPIDLMVIGKGITRFHAIYWPAILMAAKLPIPKQLFIHGYLTVNGQKMSKTLGNVVDPVEMVNKYGTDAIRYYLLREIPSFSDGDFSERRLKEIYNADLANGLGNLVARVAKLAENIEIQPNEKATTYISEIHLSTGLVRTQLTKLFESYQLDVALKYLWDEIGIVDHYLNDYFGNNTPLTVRATDKFINDKKPWSLTGGEKKAVVQVAVDAIRYTATCLQPFLPETAQKILTQFKGPKIVVQPPLFPRLP